MKKPTVRHSIVWFSAMLLFIAVASVASARGIRTDMIKRTDVQPGTYSVITTAYPVSVAILQKEGQPYHIKLKTSGTDYKVYPGLREDQAVSKAKSILEKNPYVMRTDISEIKAPDGAIIGYQMKPVYTPVYFGSYSQTGISTIDYRIRGNDVLAYVNPIPIIQYNKMGAG